MIDIVLIQGIFGLLLSFFFSVIGALLGGSLGMVWFGEDFFNVVYKHILVPGDDRVEIPFWELFKQERINLDSRQHPSLGMYPVISRVGE